jgi:cytochrome c oxidase subunit 4
MTQQERRQFLRHMRTPLLAFAALLALLGINVLLGALLPFRQAWIVEGIVMLCMVLVVLLFSMEVIHEPPLMRVFAILGFFWLAIMFGMTSVDYLSR